MLKNQKELWVGSLGTLYVAQEAEQRLNAGMVGESPTTPSRVNIIGGVGVIQISGPLVNRESIWNSLMGVTSYGEIRAALAEAVGNPLVKEILLDINSGGGAVSGVTDTASLIAHINDHVKPITAYTGGAMASGAYWLGVSAGKVYASDVAVVGSIGVITSHMDMSGSYAADGMKPTVIRAGKFKQLNSPLEALSDAGLAEIQSQLDQIYGVFVQHIADRRSVSYNVADTEMAQGREFIGSQSLKAGLVDGVMTFDTLLSNMVNKVALDSNKSFSNNHLKSTFKAKNMTLSLSEKQLATIAAGGSLTEAEVIAATTLGEVADAAAEVLAAEAAAQVVIEQTVEVAAPAQVEKTADAVVTEITTYLQTQLATANASLLELNIELRSLQASSKEALDNQVALIAIAASSVNKMNIALGGSERNLSALTAVALLAEHATVSVDFNNKFKVGGVAVAASDEVQENAKATVTPLQKARLNAVNKGK